jgi:hypothetical protein
MRPRQICWTAAAALTAVVTAASAAQGAAPAPRALTHTTSVVVRPVSRTADVTAGYSVSREKPGSLNCTAGMASPGAVDPDILECSPSAEYATACWLSHVPHRSLCLRDPREKRLVSLKRDGVMAQSLPSITSKRGPLGLRLADGTYCSIRIGGAGAILQGHRHYGITYYCQHGEAAWTPFAGRIWGIDRAHPVWTVRTAPANGHGKLRTRNVTKAWFVGMHA